ncbi:MAG: hypothetical protein E7286_02450 [Lachnospiraceae bacterium]|nr:hypothetical protein [Lachnospiraceae bacterium]
MNNILENATKYANLAAQYEFDKCKWDKDENHCLRELVSAIRHFSQDQKYSVELSSGKEPCININPNSYSGRIRKRTVGIYVIPTKGITKLFMNATTYEHLHDKYVLPECKFKNNQYWCNLNFCELCSFIEAIVS